MVWKLVRRQIRLFAPTPEPLGPPLNPLQSLHHLPRLLRKEKEKERSHPSRRGLVHETLRASGVDKLV